MSKSYHFANILTWNYFIDNPMKNDKIVLVDGFLLQLALYLLSGKWYAKTSGLNFYVRDNFSSALHLTDREIDGLHTYILPFWQNIEDISLDPELSKTIERCKDIVIGISSPKQDRLAELIANVKRDSDIYCLGAAVYTRPKIRSEILLVTWLTMFFNNPVRTIRKFFFSVSALYKTLTDGRAELLEFAKLIRDVRD